MNPEQLKDLIKTAVVEVLQERRDLLHNALVRDFEEGKRTKLTDAEFEAVADQFADEFDRLVGPNRPSLSDYAISREGIYEDHPQP